MSDIVEMLRTPTGCVSPSEWELKAAKEIERLRKALEKIAGPDPKATLDEPDLDWEVVVKLRAIASAALKRS